MFFCAGFFHCFFIVNQTERGCEEQCGDLNSKIAGFSDHLIYDSARKFLEIREKATLPKPEEGMDRDRRLGVKEYTRLYTGLFFNFTSSKWIDDFVMYNHSDITFISTSFTPGVKRASDQQCKETLRVGLHAIILSKSYLMFLSVRERLKRI